MKILFCLDDEEYMKKLIEIVKSCPCPYPLTIESYTTVVEVDCRLQSEEFDMFYLGGDIHDQSGIELAQRINERTPNKIITFICDDTRYVQAAHIVSAFQVILKGDLDSVKPEFERAIKTHKERMIQFQFKCVDGKTELFMPREVIYVNTVNKPTKIVTIKGEYYGELLDFDEIKSYYRNRYFLQVHPYYYLNCSYVQDAKEGEIYLDNGESIPIAAIYEQVILNKLRIYKKRTNIVENEDKK